MEKELKAGIFLVVDKVSKEEYLVAMAGKSPLLKVVAVLSLDGFARGYTYSYDTIINDITENPENYEFSALKTAVLPTIKKEEMEILPVGRFEEWVKRFEETDSMPEVIALIMKDTGFPYEKSQSLATEVYKRVCEKKGV